MEARQLPRTSIFYFQSLLHYRLRTFSWFVGGFEDRSFRKARFRTRFVVCVQRSMRVCFDSKRMSEPEVCEFRTFVPNTRFWQSPDTFMLDSPKARQTHASSLSCSWLINEPVTYFWIHFCSVPSAVDSCRELLLTTIVESARAKDLLTVIRRLVERGSDRHSKSKGETRDELMILPVLRLNSIASLRFLNIRNSEYVYENYATESNNVRVISIWCPHYNFMVESSLSTKSGSRRISPVYKLSVATIKREKKIIQNQGKKWWGQPRTEEVADQYNRYHDFVNGYPCCRQPSN